MCDKEDLRCRLLVIVAVIVVLLGITWCVVPVKDSMNIDSVEWRWEVSVLQYRSCPRTVNSLNDGIKFGSRHRVDSEMDEVKDKLVPSDAYDVTATIKTGTDRRKIGEDADGNALYTYDTYYYIVFSYRVDRWQQLNNLYASGFDDNPYEPKRIYPLTCEITSPEIGMYGLASGHIEYYYVNGITNDGKRKTFTISQADWKRLHDTNAKEIWFRHSRFSDEIQDMCLEEGDL